MNSPHVEKPVIAAERLAMPPLIDHLEAWVCAGLLHFWRAALPVDGGVYGLLNARIQQLLPLAATTEWSKIHARWCEALAYESQQTAQPLPLVNLKRDFQLTQAQLFVISLVGMVESSHLVNLAIAELQAPDLAPRPCVHLACALTNHLFADLTDVADAAHSPDALKDFNLLNPWDLSEQPWVQQQLINLVGDVPLPLKRLQIHPLLWSVLLGRQPLWPQVRFITPEAVPLGAQTAALVSVMAGLLGRNSHPSSARAVSGLVVRGNPNSGRGLFCYSLAQAMQLRAVEVPLELWRDQPLFLLACQYARWLPVIRPSIAPGDALRIPAAQSAYPVVFILGTDGAVDLGDMLEIELDAPTQTERLNLWLQQLDVIDADERHELARLLSASARLSAHSIHRVADHAQHLATVNREQLNLQHIAEARRKLGAEKLRLLAQPVFRQVGEDALVLPETVKESLDAVIMRACKRETLWENLGETLKVTPNPGVRALFVGESGTGKTLAASYIATRLGAPLYRVDLSAVMNKYIGESEKNLAQLLDQAAASDVVLLFDEADALFGSRSDGKENGERFANMLTNFLLTRIETHPGIVLLTTNSRERIDTAFTRRLDAIVEFPQPGFEERLHLWRSHLGERGAGEALYRSLASYCDLAGGQVRNVVLTAAAYAEGPAITVANILEGLRAEYRKQGREMPKKLENLDTGNA